LHTRSGSTGGSLKQVGIRQRVIDILSPSSYLKREYRSVHNQLIRLYIKLYPTGSLSPLLHEADLGATFAIKGPFPGEIKTESVRGRVLLLVAGTGLFPFLDLINIVTRDPVHLPSPLNQVTHINLVCSYDTEDDILCETWLRDRRQRCKATPQSAINFDFSLAVQSPRADYAGWKTYFTRAYFRRLLFGSATAMPTSPLSASQYDQIYLCGSMAFKALVQQELASVGVSSIVTSLNSTFF